MLIATILSQNTNDKNSHRAYTLLRSRFPSWEDVAAAPVRSIISTIRVGGMASQKSQRIKDVLAIVRENHGKHSLDDLRSLSNDEVIDQLTRIKGVGVKTASCVLLFSLGRDVFPVDTHVHRLCNRLGLVPDHSDTPEKTFAFMKRVFPRGRGYSFHTNLIRFGRRVCRSHNPACDICPLYDECTFQEKKPRLSLRRKTSMTDHDFMLLDNIPVHA